MKRVVVVKASETYDIARRLGGVPLPLTYSSAAEIKAIAETCIVIRTLGGDFAWKIVHGADDMRGMRQPE